MEASHLDVLKACQRWISAGSSVVLVTVLRTWGSSPRPPGAMMAIRADGAVAGSVSGGCIEDDLIADIRADGIDALCARGSPATRTYGILAEDAHRFGLPCGGTLRLVLEQLGESSAIDALVAQLEARQPVRRLLNMDTGHATLQAPQVDAPPVIEDGCFACVLGPRCRLIVIGAGQLSRYFCQSALGLDFDVLVCDPRREYCTDWDVPGVTLTHEMPDDVVIAAQPDPRTAIVTLTHDPKLDDLALIHALQSPAFYVGALGSRANHDQRCARLREHFALTDQELCKLHGPAGLYIGSKTPPEIALSILAEIVAVKNGVKLSEEVTVGPAKMQAEARSSHPIEYVCR